MQRRTTFITVIVMAVLAVFAAVFVAGSAVGARQLFDGIRSIDPAIAALGVVCSGLAMVNRGMLNRAAHRAVGLDPGVAAMTHTAAVGFAAQKLIRSAGLVGLAVFVRHGRRNGYEPGSVAAACALTATGSFLALGVLLSSAVGVLAITGRLTGWWIAATIGFVIYAAIVAVSAVLLIRSRRLAYTAWRWGQRARHRLPWGRNDTTDDTTDAAFPVEIFDAFSTARRRPDALRQLLLHAVASKALGALMLAAAVAAIGLPVSAPTAVVIYATALAASMVTVVPGGFGVVEGSTVALLIGAGATAGAAALAVALFRLFDLWLPVLGGAAAARGELRRPTSDDPPPCSALAVATTAA